jgi:hypothetical protein
MNGPKPNAPAPFPPSGAVRIRSLAAARAVSDGNRDSVKKPPPAPVAHKKGDVPPVKGEPSDREVQNPASKEATPPFAKQSLKGDGWTGAAEKAKARLRA